MIKCLILKIGTTLIAEVSEVGADVGEPDCQLTNPFRITDEEVFIRRPAVTDQRTVLMQSDRILTIVDPTEDLVNKYKESIK